MKVGTVSPTPRFPGGERGWRLNPPPMANEFINLVMTPHKNPKRPVQRAYGLGIQTPS